MSEKTEIHKSWQNFLHPLVEVMLGLGLAMTAYFQHSGSNEFESRLAVVENKVGGIDELRRDVVELSKNVYTLIGEIRAERRLK